MQPERPRPRHHVPGVRPAQPVGEGVAHRVHVGRRERARLEPGLLEHDGGRREHDHDPHPLPGPVEHQLHPQDDGEVGEQVDEHVHPADAPDRLPAGDEPHDVPPGRP